MKGKDVLELIVNITQNAIKCEENKERLNDHPKFEPYALFTRIDRDDKGFLTKKDLISFLVDNQITIPFNRNTVDLFIEYYDRDFDGHLSFSEFLNFILNKEHNLIRSIATQRETYKLCNDEYLEKDLEDFTAKLILSEFFLFEYANIKKMEMFSGSDSREVLADLIPLFIEIDSNKDGYLSNEDLSHYLSGKRVNICNEELMSFISLFDEDLDGELNWNEYLFMILPSRLYFKYDLAELKKMELQYKKYYSSKAMLEEATAKRFAHPQQFNDFSNETRERNVKVNDNDGDDSIFKGRNFKEERVFNCKANSNCIKQGNDKQLKPNITKAFSSLSSVLIEIINYETEIDELRLQLFNDPHFDMSILFSYFDRYNNRYISLMDFQEAFEVFNVTNTNLILVFGRYDHSNSGRLTFENFCEIFQPQGEKLAIGKKKKSPHNAKDIDKSTKSLLTQLFTSMVAYESFLSSLPKWYEKNKGDVFYAFDQLDVNGNGFINEEEFTSLFMGRIEEGDLLFLMEKIDSNKDGNVTLEDLISIFK